jgi:hypothetical protein
LLTHLQNCALSVIVFSNPAKVTPTEDITTQCCPQTSTFRYDTQRHCTHLQRSCCIISSRNQVQSLNTINAM